MTWLRRFALQAMTAAIGMAFMAASVQASEACFDDAQLERLQTQAGRGVLIYVWSSRMVYSVEQMVVASRAAAVNGLDLVLLHDGRAAEQEVMSAMTSKATLSVPLNTSSTSISSSSTPQRGQIAMRPMHDLATPPYVSLSSQSRPLCSSQLIALEATRHFPTAFVVTAQGMHRFPIVGAMPEAAWVQSISQRLSKP
jgi:hypothetical protein